MAKFDKLHPKYEAVLPDWIVASDCYSGERTIKRGRDRYLPITSGQFSLGIGNSNDGKPRPGQLLYDAYLSRAVFPEIVHQTVSSLVGLMVREPWAIGLPARLAYLADRASARGEKLSSLIDRMLMQLILFGRMGLLLDIRAAANEIYLAEFGAAQVINWDDNPLADKIERRIRMVALNEARAVRVPGGLDWTTADQYRVLTVGGVDALDADEVSGSYTVEVEDRSGAITRVEPMIQGRRLDFVPFTFVNSTDLVSDPGEIPMIGLARLALTIYRGEADYRHSLFMQGQDTLVLSGVSNPGGDISNATDEQGITNWQPSQTGSKLVIGAGAVIYLPDPQMSAQFIGVSSTGLSEQRQALDADHKRAEQFGMALLTSGSQAEAQSTVHTRVAARTASLASIARAAAAGLEQQLRWAAGWIGADPDEVSIVPNVDFVDARMAVGEINELITAKARGLPISWRSIHRLAEEGEITVLSLEEELEEIDGEAALIPDPNVGQGDAGAGNGDE